MALCPACKRPAPGMAGYAPQLGSYETIEERGARPLFGGGVLATVASFLSGAMISHDDLSLVVAVPLFALGGVLSGWGLARLAERRGGGASARLWWALGAMPCVNLGALAILLALPPRNR